MKREKAIRSENDYPWIMETRRQALNYTGEYIWCYESWIFYNDGQNQDLLNKVNSEYDRVDNLIVQYTLIYII
jgi:hypothetical protein